MSCAATAAALCRCQAASSGACLCVRQPYHNRQMHLMCRSCAGHQLEGQLCVLQYGRCLTQAMELQDEASLLPCPGTSGCKWCASLCCMLCRCTRRYTNVHNATQFLVVLLLQQQLCLGLIAVVWAV
jgi:hypothetical protein